MSRAWRAILACSVLAVPAWGSAADWPQFRGPGGSATSVETGLPTTWGPGENLVWKAELPGPGASSPVTTGDRIFLTCYTGYGLDEGNPGNPSNLARQLICVNRADGEVVWTKDVPAQMPEEPFDGFQALHGYASSTPATDGRNVYVFFGRSGVLAYSLAGKRVWQTDVGEGVHDWGSAASPVLYKDLVIVNAGVESGALVALKTRNGDVAWRQDGVRSSWSTPLVVPVGRKSELVLSIEGAIGGFDPDKGTPLWQCDGIQDYVCPTPVAAGGVVFAIGGRQGQNLAVRAGGKGNVTESRRLWEGRGGSNVTSPVLHDGHVYWVSDDGIAYCVASDSGNTVYQERLNNAGQVYASLVSADGKLYAVTRNNGTFVLAASPQFEVLAENPPLDDSVFNAGPAVSDGQLLLRSNRYLYCIGEK
jgi:outer membrane protein assembly factor BamB